MLISGLGITNSMAFAYSYKHVGFVVVILR